MKKFFYLPVVLIFNPLFFIYNIAWALDAPLITATPKAPNQINLTWDAVSNPGWGYKVEIQSDDDSRYSDWTELSWQSATPQSTTGGSLTYLPYWVTEGHYLDVTDGIGTASGACKSASASCGSPAQAQIYGLKHSTTYKFRVRTWGKTDAGAAVYSSYSTLIEATTPTPATIRYVTTTGAGSRNGTSWENAYDDISDANGISVSGGHALVLIEAGNYASDNITPTRSGTQEYRIVFQAYNGGPVNITSPSATIAVDTNRQDYIIVDGINTTYRTNNGQPRFYIDQGSSRVALVNFAAAGQTGGDLWGVVDVKSSYNLVHNYYVHDNGAAGIDNRHSNIQIYGPYNHNIFQLGVSIRGAHDCFLIKGAATYNQLKNSRHGGEWGHGVNLVNDGSAVCKYNLVEGNTFNDICKEHTLRNFYKNAMQAPSSTNTLRRNVVYDGHDGSGGKCKGLGFELNKEGGGATGSNLVYNNTVYNNGGAALVIWNGTTNNKIVNNIFYNNGSPPCTDPGLECTSSVVWADNVTGLDIHHNFISQNSDQNYNSIEPNVWYDDPQTLSEAESSYPSIIHNNYGNLTLGFIDLETEVIHLKSTSDAIDAGQQVIDNIWGTILFKGSAPDLGAFEYSGISGPAAPKNLRIVPTQ